MAILHDNESGTLVRHADFASRHVRPRHVDVWRPPGDPGARYPVIYMHDGQNLFLAETAYGGIPWSVDRAVWRLMQEERIPGAMVVGIWSTGDDRWREYLPQKPMADPRAQEFIDRFFDRLRGPVVSDAYVRFLVEELKPFIDAAYPTRPDQPSTLLMGSSMGGLISLYTLTEHPRVFGGAGCVSTHWPAGEDLLVDYLGSALPPPGAHRLYFDFGTETLDAAYEPLQRRMDEHLRRAGYRHGRDWLTRKFPGAEHSEVAWRERVHIPLEFLLGQPEAPDR